MVLNRAVRKGLREGDAWKQEFNEQEYNVEGQKWGERANGGLLDDMRTLALLQLMRMCMAYNDKATRRQGLCLPNLTPPAMLKRALWETGNIMKRIKETR